VSDADLPDLPDDSADPWPRGRARHGGVDEVPLPPTVPGRLWLAGKRYVAPDPASALSSVGAEVVVCLCESFELRDRYPGYVEWLDDSGQGIWWPVPDLHPPPFESAEALVADVVGHLETGASVLMHCGAGMGRAGTIAVAVLMHYGVAMEEAIGQVAAARPGAGPEVGAQKDLLIAMSGP
jgi:hypothetical protein